MIMTCSSQTCRVLFAGEAKQLLRAEETPGPSAWWVLPTPALAVVLLMQHKSGGLIISIEVNYISHYSKSPVHAMLSTSFNSLPPVTVDFCTELLLYSPCPSQARSGIALEFHAGPWLALLPLSVPAGGDRGLGWEQVGHAVPQGQRR